MKTLSGNHASWITTIAREIREAGKPASFDFLYRVVPSQFATARNDGHVTAAENGLSRDDYAAGWRIWIEEALATLLAAGLISGDADGYSWAVEQDGLWKVKFGRSSYTIYGRAESAAARDRHMLGEGSDQPGYLLKGYSEVEVEIERGIDRVIDKGRHTLQVHPLAFAIPPMTPAEQEMLRADIAKHGVLMPLVLYPDKDDLTVRKRPKQKVLDGRHRLQFASALDKPVRVESFKGTEKEARQYIGSLNLARRHLTPIQWALVIERLYGESARKKANKNHGGDRKSGRNQASESEGLIDHESGGGEWPIRALNDAGNPPGVTAHAVRAAAEIAKAPKTAARVDSGEIATVVQARKEAAVELGQPVPSPLRQEPFGTELGSARGHLDRALEMLDRSGFSIGKNDLRVTLDEIKRLERLIRGRLDKRGLL